MTLAHRILCRLERGPASITDLCPHVHASNQVVGAALRQLLEQQLVHLHGWRRSTRGPFTRLFALGRGSGRIPPQPAKYTAPQRSKRWRDSGGDHHRSTRLKRAGKRIAACMTLAGQLGIKPGNTP